jgi:phosphatidylinositol alpha-1,6-mannosyltransferase
LNLLIVSSEFPPGPGGIGTHAYAVGRGLAGRGWRVQVVTPQDYATQDERARFAVANPELAIIPARASFPFIGPPGKALDRWRLARGATQRTRPDVIMATGARAAWVAATLKHTSRAAHHAPLVMVGHGTEFGLRSFWERPLTRWAFAQAEHVVCVSEYTRRYMLERGYKPRATSVIPNGADETRFAPQPEAPIAAFRAQHNLQDRAVLLTVGHVSERKGQRVVIEALPKVAAQFPNVLYIAAGVPTQAEALKTLAASLGVADKVQFWGRTDAEKLLMLFNSCEIFVMTSVHTASGDFEGYGIALVEAALCGKPSVASGDSGLAEALIDGETGVLVPQNDPDATAHAIIGLLSDPTRRQTMGERARAHALAEQTWAKRVSRYDELFRGLAARGQTKA